MEVRWIVAAFITLHNPIGEKIYIGADIIAVRPPSVKPVPLNCHAEVIVHDHTFCVFESPAEIVRLVEENNEHKG